MLGRLPDDGSQEQRQDARLLFTSFHSPTDPYRAQSPLPHIINKHGIVFIDDEQWNHYDELVSWKISEPKYVDVGLSQSLHLWDDMNSLFGVLGWTEYVQLQFSIYEKFVWEFFHSFIIDGN